MFIDMCIYFQDYGSGYTPLHLLSRVPPNVHIQFPSFLFYSITASLQENGSTRMIQSMDDSHMVAALNLGSRSQFAGAHPIRYLSLS